MYIDLFEIQIFHFNFPPAELLINNFQPNIIFTCSDLDHLNWHMNSKSNHSFMYMHCSCKFLNIQNKCKPQYTETNFFRVRGNFATFAIFSPTPILHAANQLLSYRCDNKKKGEDEG